MIVRSLAELAAELDGDVVRDGSTLIHGVAGIREAMPGDITFLANTRYESYLTETRASAVICSREPRFAALLATQTLGIARPHRVAEQPCGLATTKALERVEQIVCVRVVPMAQDLGAGPWTR